MTEFLGLAYFAEIPAVLFDVQRAGPSTGMPTRTQQADLLGAAYASHGDTKHVLLFPSNPKECFEFAADAFDLADRLQTPIIVMTDLELGMNDTLSEPFTWDDDRVYDRGKVYHAADLEALERAGQRFGRYRDVDGDGIGYRTYPGTHPAKGSFFTRGTSRDEWAAYTEAPEVYIQNMDRLLKKWATAATLVPKAEIDSTGHPYGIVYYGTSAAPMREALDLLAAQGIKLDAMRIRGFPFGEEVYKFIEQHEKVFLVEQNRDSQMRTLIVTEGLVDPKKFIPVCYYGGMSISADFINERVASYFADHRLPRISEVKR
jgi:2-oxoglutarate ferredoxin oxidoreductase subunit alpha